MFFLSCLSNILCSSSFRGSLNCFRKDVYIRLKVTAVFRLFPLVSPWGLFSLYIQSCSPWYYKCSKIKLKIGSNWFPGPPLLVCALQILKKFFALQNFQWKIFPVLTFFYNWDSWTVWLLIALICHLLIIPCLWTGLWTGQLQRVFSVVIAEKTNCMQFVKKSFC